MLQRTAPALERLRSASAEQNEQKKIGVANLIKKIISPRQRRKQEDLIDFDEFRKLALEGDLSWIFEPFATTKSHERGQSKGRVR